LNLFYHPNITEASNEVIFDKEESRHISKVLRKNYGDVIDLTNGKGLFFAAKLINTNPKKCIGEIVKFERQAPLPYHLHMAVAPTKLNDRFEWFLEKATEIGITEITPIICDHSERKVINVDRYNKIIQSAMKQSLKAYLPLLNPVVALRDFISREHSEEIKCIAHCEESDKQLLKNIIQQGRSILILIGPEGDFSENEIKLAIEQNFKPISLGNSRLRTETAALVACHSVYYTAVS